MKNNIKTIDDYMKLYLEAYDTPVLPTIKSGLDFILNNVEPSGVIFAALDESKFHRYFIINILYIIKYILR